MSNVAPQPTDPGDDSAYAAERLTVAETIARTHDFMAENLGAPLGAKTIYRGVFGEPFDGSDMQAVRNRERLYHLFTPGINAGERFFRHCIDEGKAVQSGMLMIDRPDPDAKQKGRKVFRMHAVASFIPDLHDEPEFYNGYFINWDKAVTDVSFVPRELPEHISVDSLQKEVVRRKAKPKPPVVHAAKLGTVKKPIETPAWLPPFKKAVVAAIDKVAADDLMIDGQIPASQVKRKARGSTIGTETNLERLYAAKLINRAQLKQAAPLTAETVVLAALFNPHKHLLGQKNKAQRVAVETVRDAVKTYFKEVEDQA